MKRYDPESLGDVLRDTLQEAGLTERLLETQAAAVWPRVAGSYLAEQTGKPYVRAGVMQIRVPGASLRHDLNMNRTTLRNLINREVGKEIISELRFV